MSNWEVFLTKTVKVNNMLSMFSAPELSRVFVGLSDNTLRSEAREALNSIGSIFEINSGSINR